MRSFCQKCSAQANYFCIVKKIKEHNIRCSFDFFLYDNRFFTIIEFLLEIAYNKKQQALINWWIYEKWDHPEGVLILTNQDTGEEIPTDTAEELYELLQII